MHEYSINSLTDYRSYKHGLETLVPPCKSEAMAAEGGFTAKSLKAVAEWFFWRAPSVRLVLCHPTSHAEAVGSVPPQLHTRKRGRPS